MPEIRSLQLYVQNNSKLKTNNENIKKNILNCGADYCALVFRLSIISAVFITVGARHRGRILFYHHGHFYHDNSLEGTFF
jgi:hypothetical protein